MDKGKHSIRAVKVYPFIHEGFELAIWRFPCEQMLRF